MAESGAKTILVDCDERKLRLHKIFFISNEKGLSDVLVGRVKFEEAVQETVMENLNILTSGTRSPNPSELLLKVNANILGIILNKLEIREKGYYGY